MPWFHKFNKHVYMGPADDGTGASGGGGSPTTTTTAQPGSQESRTFSHEYVRELREENKATRLRLQAAEDAKKAADDAVVKAQNDANERVSAAEKSASDRLLRAELKAAAIKAGIVDVDGLKLADTSKLKFNDAGEIEGLDDFVDAFKKAKPFLFTAAGSSTSSTAPKPAPKDNAPLDASKLSDDDFEKAYAKLIGR